jgi:hypothetical protein
VIYRPEPQAEIISPLPWKKLIALMIIATAETINYNSIYPYINFMVKDLCNISDTRELGYGLVPNCSAEQMRSNSHF